MSSYCNNIVFWVNSKNTELGSEEELLYQCHALYIQQAPSKNGRAFETFPVNSVLNTLTFVSYFSIKKRLENCAVISVK